MRILVANHIDDSIRARGDMRAWTQRIFWFARQGDVVVLSDHPDEQFLSYATSLTGVDPSTLRIHVPPPGRYGHRFLDPASLTDEDLLREVASDLTEVSEIFALWPSAQVARFAAALGLTDRLPGADFFAQGGGELVNNKSYFRPLAAAKGVPIAPGSVCRSVNEAVAAMTNLLTGTGAVVVKQAHNGAGVGNQLVITRDDVESGHAGARHIHRLGQGREEIEAYWEQRWDWASAGGRFAVVVEEFRPKAMSIYSEHYVDDAGVRPTETGILIYVARRLSHQIVPLRSVDEATRNRLVEMGTRLAEAYRAVGYRGHLSADAIVDAEGQVIFTEVNAQVSGSLHIYDVIAHRIVDTSVRPERSIVEHHVPPNWAVADFDDFVDAIEDLGCGYDPETRTGVIVSMPIIPLQMNRAQFLFCIAFGTEEQWQSIYQRLDDRFASIPESSYTETEHIGVPQTAPA